MKPPFVFGKLATEQEFTNRQQDVDRLVMNFSAGTNTIIISPRRWGKSSLVTKAASDLGQTNSKIRLVFMDLFNIRNEADFYKTLAEQVLLSVSDKIEQLTTNIKRFMKQWIPRISFSPDASLQVSFGLDWNEVQKEPSEILNLAEKVAIDKGIRIVICIDEFQNIAYYDDPLAFQKTLRSVWQKHQNVSYCLYGSKRHMLMEVFAAPSMPFYKFGDLIFLDKIRIEDWRSFIQQRFSDTSKSITSGQADRIASAVACHPYYVQQLAQICWLRTETIVQDSTIEDSVDHLILQLSMLFQSMTENLSSPQINYLKAVINGVKKLSAAQTIRDYHLGSSANVAVIKKALIQKEIIDDHQGEIQLLDPVYALWLDRYYFR
jgi:hypothetical protein